MLGSSGNGGAVPTTRPTRTSMLALRTGSAAAADTASTGTGLAGALGDVVPVPEGIGLGVPGMGVALIVDGVSAPVGELGRGRPAETGTTDPSGAVDVTTAGASVDEPGDAPAVGAPELARGGCAEAPWCCA